MNGITNFPMKINILVLIICIFYFQRVNALTIDTLLIKDYARGYEYVQEIVEVNNLNDSLKNKSYCSIFFQNLWAITVKNDDNFVLYYGYQISNDIMERKEIHKDELILSQLFDVDKDKIRLPILSDMVYHPSYWYFSLVGTNHIKKIEWNCRSTSEDEYAKQYSEMIEEYIVYLMSSTLKDKLGVPEK